MTPKANNLLNALLRKKSVALFLAISNERSDSYCRKLSIKAHCTHSHALGLLEKMRGAGLLTFDKRGRTKNVRLTAKGVEVSKNLERLAGSLELL